MKVRHLVVLIVSALLTTGLLGGVWAFGFGSAATKDEAAAMEALRAAPVCEALPENPAACTWEDEFEFVGSEYHEGIGRSAPWYSIDLRETQHDPDGSPGFVHTVGSFEREDVEGLTYGAPVTATLWRGQIIEMRLHGRDVPTRHHPVDVPAPLAKTQRTAFMLVAGGILVAGALVPFLQQRRARVAAPEEHAGD